MTRNEETSLANKNMTFFGYANMAFFKFEVSKLEENKVTVTQKLLGEDFARSTRTTIRKISANSVKPRKQQLSKPKFS